MRLALPILIAALGCDHGMRPPDAERDAPNERVTCTADQEAKIRFEQATGCRNDGSVEFCIPDGDPALRRALAGIAPAIRCGQGGGRANCMRIPGLLLCSYPTRVPQACVFSKGPMTPAAWSDMCEIAVHPQITAIVHTFYE